nr:glutamate receptor 4-like [Cherax quadricarinatus]
MHLIVGAEQWVPWLRFTHHEVTGKLTYSGIMHNLLLALSQTMNFTEVDFALGPFTINWERYHYCCQFSQPIFMDYTSVFIRRSGLQTDLFAFSRPFQWQVWLGLVAAAVLTWIVLFVFFYLSPYEQQTVINEYNKKSEKSQAKQKTSTEKSPTMWIIGTLFNQGEAWMPVSASRRVMTAVWLFFCFIFISVFSSTLTAMLSMPKVVVPIDSMKDLVSQRRVPWTIESGSSFFQIVSQATEGLYKALWTGHSHTITDCYTFRNDILAGKYASICDKMTMKKVGYN